MARFDFSDDAAAAWFDPARQHLQGADDPPIEETAPQPAELVDDAPPSMTSETLTPSEPAISVEGLIATVPAPPSSIEPTLPQSTPQPANSEAPKKAAGPLSGQGTPP